MDDLFRRFDETRDFVGTLEVNGIEVAECQGRVSFNQYNTNGMSLEIQDFPHVKIPELPDKPTNEELHALDIKLIERQPQFMRWASFSGPYLVMGTTARSLKAPVEEYGWREDFADGPADRAFFKYCFPLTTVAMSRSGGVMDELHGFYHGDLDRESESVKLSKDLLKYRFLGIESTIYELIANHELDRNGRYPIQALVKQSCLTFPLDISGESEEDMRDRASQYASTNLALVSLLEQNRIRWTSEEINWKRNTKWIRQEKRYRWASPPSKKYESRLATQRGARESMVVVTKAFEALDGTARKSFLEALRNFEVANCSDVLETKLIFWYACLDRVLKTVFKTRRGSFSSRLVKVCDRYELNVFDLIEEEVFQYWRSKPDEGKTVFDFVARRNEFVHEGPTPRSDQILPLSDTVRKVRALAERIILRALGIGHDGLSIGKPSLNQ